MTKRKRAAHDPIVAVAGGISVGYIFEKYGASCLSVRDEKDVAIAIRYADAIVLTGGGDVHPRRYGEERWHPQVYGVDKERDALEFELVRRAQERGLLMFGICRGLQVLNVAFGGTLHQDIDQYSSTASHHGGVQHAVVLRKGSRLQKALGKDGMLGTSIHHQAVDRIGHGLMPAGWAKDGIIEAIESAPGAGPYVLATQFHPEMDHRDDKDAAAIFKHFVKMARIKADRRKSTMDRKLLINKMAGTNRMTTTTYKPPATTDGLVGKSNCKHGYTYHSNCETDKEADKRITSMNTMLGRVYPTGFAPTAIRNKCPHGFTYSCTQDSCSFDDNTGYVKSSVDQTWRREWEYAPKCKHGFVFHETEDCKHDGYGLARNQPGHALPPAPQEQLYAEYEREYKRLDHRSQEDAWSATEGKLLALNKILEEVGCEIENDSGCIQPPCPYGKNCNPDDGDCLKAAIVEEDGAFEATVIQMKRGSKRNHSQGRGRS